MTRQNRYRALSLAVMALGFWGAVPALAAVTPGGDTTVSTSDTYVGKNGIGTLGIDGGSSVSNRRGFVGYNAGSNGIATVSGAGSRWTNSSNSLYVGYSGSGTLHIGAGAQVSNLYAGYLGYDSGSSGTATVSGAGATWSNIEQALYVGRLGQGVLDILGGGQVNSRGGILAYSAGTTGTVTVSGAGSKWTSSDTTANFFVGYAGFGTLAIEDGGELSSNSFAYLGYDATSTGLATVHGDGSKWTTRVALDVGCSGGGTLMISAGGEVSTGIGRIGRDAGSIGTATVSGTGSKWLNTSELEIGGSGSGTLTIGSGGQVSNTIGYIGDRSGSSGAATVSGAGSTWTNNGDLYVGRSANGTMTIDTSGQVSSVNGYVGHSAGSAGIVAVSGTGSTWSNAGDLFVGRFGTGSLTVADGGSVTVAKTLYASLSDLHGDGTITVSGGAVLDTDLLFDSTHGATQSLAFGSGGALNISITGTGALGAGHRDSGSLRIADGLVVTSAGGYLGFAPNSAGTAMVTGSGSTWSNSGESRIGSSGSGALRIESGGQASNTNAFIGDNVGSMGSATVSGAESKWISSGDLYVGRSGSGTMSIDEGGQVRNVNGYLGHSAGSAGTSRDESVFVAPPGPAMTVPGEPANGPERIAGAEPSSLAERFFVAPAIFLRLCTKLLYLVFEVIP